MYVRSTFGVELDGVAWSIFISSLNGTERARANTRHPATPPARPRPIRSIFPFYNIDGTEPT